MNKLFWIFLAITTLTFTACEKEYYEPQFEEDEEWYDDDFNDDDGGDSEEGALTLYTVNGDNITKQRDFDVASNLLTYQQDQARHQEIWDFFVRLVPADFRTRIVEFEVIYGNNDLQGYVAPLDDNDLSRWKMGLAIEAAGDLSKIDFNELFTQVVIHELAHVLTLDETQVNVGGSDRSCAEYYTGEGCSIEPSYINRLFDLGWADIFDQHDDNDPYATYDRYPDRFVSDYAATNPGEDIAETIAFFITEPTVRTGNTIADQKIQLMYEFPTLVRLRDEIRANDDAIGLTRGVSLGGLRKAAGLSGAAHAGHRH